ncbi:MAG: OmpA family protein [Nitrospinota bacterium]
MEKKLSVLKNMATLAAFFIFLFYGFSQASGRSPVYGPFMLHFLSGTTELESSSLERVKKIRELLHGIDVDRIEIEGFTDGTPLHTESGFRDNVELAKARAKAVATELQKNLSLSKDIFITRGSNSRDYIATNNTVQGRALNRRAEIRIFGEILEGATHISKQKEAKSGKSELLETLSFRDVDIREAFEMLSKKGHVNVVLEKGVQGNVNLNLFGVSLETALETTARSAGFFLKKSEIGYTVSHPEVVVAPVKEKVVPKIIKKFEVKYFNVDYKLREDLAKFLTEKGVMSVLPERNIIIVEDTEATVKKIEELLSGLDVRPRQILIEAKILEVSLDESETFGLDWSKIFAVNGGTGSAGVENLATGSSGFIFKVTNDDVDLFFNALHKKGKVRTLSTPKLLTMENKEASVIIGDRQGFKVTTTIDQVTTESVEFLESGIKLRVIPAVDREGKVLMHIIPEVSTGSIQDGIPAQITTKVTTTLQADDGQPVFIGGLMKNRVTETKSGVPLLEKIPVLSYVFSSREESVVKTETVVIITPYIIDKPGGFRHIEEEVKKLF